MSEETTAEAKAKVVLALEDYIRIKPNPRHLLKVIELVRRGAKPMGRPRGEAKDDTPSLRLIASLVENGKAKNPYAAARQVAAGLSEKHVQADSTIRRLYNKYRDRESELRAEVRSRPKPRFEDIKRDVATAIQKMDEGTASATTGVILQQVPELLEPDAQTE